tara:strand:+ start:196 stop:324 length:129 start_codon:yes stop_codon:yes gene_type:complete
MRIISAIAASGHFRMLSGVAEQIRPSFRQVRSVSGEYSQDNK